MTSDRDPGAPAIQAVAALADDLRRGMYTFCRRARRPVTRDEAAAEVGISRKLAAFHLDKLVDAGLLNARYEPVGGIRKVGRAPKVYEPTDESICVAIPDRRHDLLADVLLDAVLSGGADESASAAALRVAEQRGVELGERELRNRRPGRIGAERALSLAEVALTRLGFEPRRMCPTRVRLGNCPFHPLAARAPELVCGLNHALLTGFLIGLGATTTEARLAPAAGECCVELTAR